MEWYANALIKYKMWIKKNTILDSVKNQNDFLANSLICKLTGLHMNTLIIIL